jgi:hypothetical protein
MLSSLRLPLPSISIVLRLGMRQRFRQIREAKQSHAFNKGHSEATILAARKYFLVRASFVAGNQKLFVSFAPRQTAFARHFFQRSLVVQLARLHHFFDAPG